MDGNAVGRATVLRTFRRTAAPFGWTCDDDAILIPLAEVREVPEPASRSRDNPEADPEYEDAFDRGRSEVVSRLSNDLLVNSTRHGLFVARGGHVVSVSMASDLVLAAIPTVSSVRTPEDSPSPHDPQAIVPRAEALTDEALHAFLDRDPARRIERPQSTVGSDGPAPTSPRADRRSWVPDRRTLLGGAVGALLTGSLFPVVAKRFGSIAPRSNPVRAQSGAYVPPAHWDDLPPTSRNFFLAWDQLVWNLEQSDQGLADLHQALQVVMATPGYEPLKRSIITFLTDSRRTAHHWDLLQGLIPGASSPLVQASILSCITEHVVTLGRQVVAPNVVDGLLAYRTVASTQGGDLLALLNRLLALLGH